MARHEPLRVHLIAVLDGERMTTACGREAIPHQGRSFSGAETRWEGRVPGSAGAGILVYAEAAFPPFPGSRAKACETCLDRYERGERK